MSFIFRPHRGSLDEAMAECVILESKQALIDHIAAELEPWPYTLTTDDLTLKPYGYDERICWDTHIVTLKNYGVLGFTNGAV